MMHIDLQLGCTIKMGFFTYKLMFLVATYKYILSYCEN